MIRHLVFCLLLSVGLSPALAAGDGEKDEFFFSNRYERVNPPQPTDDPDRIEVREMFWYGCPHCYDFEPYINRWLENRPDDVAFVRTPAIFRPGWEVHARAWYAAVALGVTDRIHGPLFDALHKHKRRIRSKEEVLAFFVEQGIDRQDFLDAYDSFSTASKVRLAGQLSARYGIRGVPSVIVNGKYRTSGSLAGSYDNLLKVVDYLVDMERKAAGKD